MQQMSQQAGMGGMGMGMGQGQGPAGWGGAGMNPANTGGLDFSRLFAPGKSRAIFRHEKSCCFFDRELKAGKAVERCVKSVLSPFVRHVSVQRYE